MTTLSCLKAFLLFVVFASDLEEIAGRQVLLELLDLRQQRGKDLRGQHAGDRERGYRDRAELVAALDFRYCHLGRDVRYLPQRYALIAGQRVDVGILNIRQSGAFLHPQTNGDRDLFVSFPVG